LLKMKTAQRFSAGFNDVFRSQSRQGRKKDRQLKT